MDEPPKYTLVEALEIARAKVKGEPPMLYAPRLDQPPTANPIVGEPVPPGVVIRRPPHPNQMPLALKPVEQCPTRAQQQAFDAHWEPIDRSIAAEKAVEAKKRATREAIEAEKAAAEVENQYWGFAQSPESLRHKDPLPEGVFRVADIVRQPWCRSLYKTPTRLVKALKAHYPERILACGLLTRAGFDIFLEGKLAAERESDRVLKEKTRATKRAAKQVPGPIIGAKQGARSGESA